MTIALYHFHVTQIKRSAGQSAVAAVTDIYRLKNGIIMEHWDSVQK